MASHEGYSSSHPWYYKLGGRILTPAEIMAEVESIDRCSGDKHLIDKLEGMSEPKRSKEVQRAIDGCLESQKGNIKRYSEVTRQLTYERERPGPYEWDKSRTWNDPTTAVFLKHNHISHDHATLVSLRALVSVQMELF